MWDDDFQELFDHLELNMIFREEEMSKKLIKLIDLKC